MRPMKMLISLLLVASSGVPAAVAAEVPPVTMNRQAARPGDGPVVIPDRPPLPGKTVPPPSVGAVAKQEKGSGHYIMVLWEAGTPVPGDAAKKIIKKVAEPDIPALGGQVLFSRDNRRWIELPLKAAKKLRHHEAVVSLQRLWTGELREEWAEPADTETAAEPAPTTGNSRLAVKTDVDTNLEWGPLTYQYDGSGNIKQTASTATTDSYIYDSAGRLIQATVKGQTESYAYDAFGNMTAKGIAGAAAMTIPVDGGSNRLIGPSYDAAGNVLSRDGKEAYEYDSLNMLSLYRSGTLSTYTLQMVYDPDDERLGVLLADGSSRWSMRDFGGQVIREYDGVPYGNTLVLTWQGDFIRGEGGQLLAGETPVWQYNNVGSNSTAQYGGLRHYHLDHLGSVRLVTDSEKRTLGEHDYYPYGVTPTKAYQEELNPGTPHIDPMRYAGHQRDFLGLLNVENTDYLDYMHARYYDPKMGRFLSVDPVMSSADPHFPQTWNRYTYALNNPLKYIDPTGENTIVVCDPDNNCVATVEAQIVADPNNSAEMAAARDFSNGAINYWQGLQETGPNGENITFQINITIVAPGHTVAGADTLTVVSGSGRSFVQQTLNRNGGESAFDTGTVFTTDSTGNPSGMSGVSAHETGHLFGFPDLYYQTIPSWDASPAKSIMEFAQPTNGLYVGHFVLTPLNGNNVVYRQQGPPRRCMTGPC